jgi:hypothetical protein
MKRTLLVLGILILFATEILRVYFIMPFPGSQHRNTIDLAYFIDHNRLWFRIAGFVLIGYALLIHPAKTHNPYGPRRKKKTWPAYVLLFFALLYGVVFFFFNYRFEADRMFYQPGQLSFADSAANKVSASRLVIGVVIDNKAKAYPIQLIGYHHQVRDTFGKTPIMVTYCTVCRTGRVYSPVVRGRNEQFRLVGMDHFNAMFEDAATKSWWQQATGAAIAGPLKGHHLAEIPSAQYTLGEWLRLHPASAVMQPDPAYAKEYEGLTDYDKGTIKGGLEKRDSASWKAKSWVIGVLANHHAKAYDWTSLPTWPINDTIGQIPVIILRNDSNFHTWSRTVSGQTLSFVAVKSAACSQCMSDTLTHTIWTNDGLCVAGPLKGQQLQPLQSYQEFWHSWRHFHPTTTKYTP